MNLKENRTLAWIVAAVCIVGSVFGLSNASLAGDRTKLVQLFYDGEDKSSAARHSMDRYLDDAGENAALMASEAQLQLGGAVKATADEMTQLSGIVGESDDFSARWQAYQTLKKDADVLYNAMYGANLPEEKYVNFKKAYDDFFGADKFIQMDPYRGKASDFNKELQGFPAGLITGIGGIEPLEPFGA